MVSVAKASPRHCDMLPNELDIEMPAKPRRSISHAMSSVARRSPGLAINARAGSCAGIGGPPCLSLRHDIVQTAAALVLPPRATHASTMARFSVQAWDDTARLRRAIHDLPFNRELAAGTLGRERFRFYIEQDAVYLDGFARTLTLAAARAPDTTLLEHFANAALVAIVVERALHERRLQSSAS